jgi:hypothetical protein
MALRVQFCVLGGRYPWKARCGGRIRGRPVKTWRVIRRLHSRAILGVCDSVKLLYSSCVLVATSV